MANGEEVLTPTRGERNNNPGNIRESAGDATRWAGERSTDDDKSFEEFDSPEYGIRALAKVLLNYQRVHRLSTITQIVHRWAPPSENATDAYVRGVVNLMNVGPNYVLDLNNVDTLKSLVRAIITMENGRCVYDDATIATGLGLAYA